jgi:hypothetical protein
MQLPLLFYLESKQSDVLGETGEIQPFELVKGDGGQKHRLVDPGESFEPFANAFVVIDMCGHGVLLRQSKGVRGKVRRA